MSQTAKRTALVASLGASLAFAQFTPDWYKIYEDGVQVGEIYVPQWGISSRYDEHWILYPNYVYPSPRTGVRAEIVPEPHSSYASETDFFARVPFGPGYRYVHVTSEDSAQLPRP